MVVVGVVREWEGGREGEKGEGAEGYSSSGGLRVEWWHWRERRGGGREGGRKKNAGHSKCFNRRA